MLILVVAVGRTTKQAFAEYFANSNGWIEDGKPATMDVIYARSY